MEIFNVGLSQTIDIVPRFLGSSNFILELHNEDTRKKFLFDNSNIVFNESTYPVLNMTFEHECKEGEVFQIKLIDSDSLTVLWRGKSIATEQVTQNYRINKDY